MLTIKNSDLLLIIWSFALLEGSQQISLPSELWNIVLCSAVEVDADDWRQEISSVLSENRQSYLDEVMRERHATGYLGFSPSFHLLCQAYPNRILTILEQDPFFIKDMRELFLTRAQIYLSDLFIMWFLSQLPARESYPEHQIYTVFHNYISFQNPDKTIKFHLFKSSCTQKQILKIPLGRSLLDRNRRFFQENRAYCPLIPAHINVYENIAEIFYSPFIKNNDREKQFQQLFINENLSTEHVDSYVSDDKFKLLQDNLRNNPYNKLPSVILYMIQQHLLCERDEGHYITLLKPDANVLIFFRITHQYENTIILYFLNEIKKWFKENSSEKDRVANLSFYEKIEKNPLQLP